MNIKKLDYEERLKILKENFEPTSFDDKIEMEDLQIVITLNPDLSKILLAIKLAQEQVKLCNIPPVSGRVCFSSDCFYHDKTTDTCVGDYAKCTVRQTHR